MYIIFHRARNIYIGTIMHIPTRCSRSWCFILAENIYFQDKTLKMNEIIGLRGQIEREYREKVKLEDDVLEKMRSQLTLDKASKYTDKLTKKLRTRTKELVSLKWNNLYITH